MNLETYVTECCEAWKHNPPHRSEGSDDPERLRWLVRYYARTNGAGFAGYSDAEVEKYLYLFWDAYIHAFFNTNFMKLMGNFSNKQLFAWIMEAKHEAEKAGMNCAKAAQHNMQRTVGDSPAPQALPRPETLSIAEADATPAQPPLM